MIITRKFAADFSFAYPRNIYIFLSLAAIPLIGFTWILLLISLLIYGDEFAASFRAFCFGFFPETCWVSVCMTHGIRLKFDALKSQVDPFFWETT